MTLFKKASAAHAQPSPAQQAPVTAPPSRGESLGKRARPTMPPLLGQMQKRNRGSETTEGTSGPRPTRRSARLSGGASTSQQAAGASADWKKEETKAEAPESVEALKNGLRDALGAKPDAQTLIVEYSSTGGGHTARCLDPVIVAAERGYFTKGDVIVIAAPPRWTHDNDGGKVNTLHDKAKELANKHGLKVFIMQADKTAVGHYYGKNQDAVNAGDGAPPSREGDSNNPAILRQIVYAPRRDDTAIPQSVSPIDKNQPEHVQGTGFAVKDIVAAVMECNDGNPRNIKALGDMAPALHKAAEAAGITERVEIGNHQLLFGNDFAYRPELHNAILSKVTAAGRYTKLSVIDYDTSINPFNADLRVKTFERLGIKENTTKAEARKKVVEHLWCHVNVVDPSDPASVAKGGVICPAWQQHIKTVITPAAEADLREIEHELLTAAQDHVKKAKNVGMLTRSHEREVNEKFEQLKSEKLAELVREYRSKSVPPNADAVENMAYLYLNEYTERVASGLGSELAAKHPNAVVAVCKGSPFEHSKIDPKTNLLHMMIAANADGATNGGFGTTSEYLFLMEQGYEGHFVVAPVVNQHEQEANANYMVQKGAGKVQRQTPPAGVVQAVLELFDRRKTRQALAGPMGKLVSSQDLKGNAPSNAGNTAGLLGGADMSDRSTRVHDTVQAKAIGENGGELPEHKEVRRLLKLVVPALDSMISSDHRPKKSRGEYEFESAMPEYREDGQFDVQMAHKNNGRAAATIHDALELLDSIAELNRADALPRESQGIDLGMNIGTSPGTKEMARKLAESLREVNQIANPTERSEAANQAVTEIANHFVRLGF